MGARGGQALVAGIRGVGIMLDDEERGGGEGREVKVTEV
jgi:hypothetical protein